MTDIPDGWEPFDLDQVDYGNFDEAYVREDNNHQVAVAHHEGSWYITAYPELEFDDLMGLARPVAEADLGPYDPAGTREEARTIMRDYMCGINAGNWEER